jgi:ParB family chromosome partitioning protein
MSNKEKPKPRLGRGLASLLGAVAEVRDSSTIDSVSHLEHPEVSEAAAEENNSISASTEAVSSDRPHGVPVTQIAPNPYQPRLQIDPAAMSEMVESIRLHGVIQPIVVRPKNGGFELLAGQRRLEAVRQLGLAEIPAIIRDATDQQVLEIALIENIHREDLNCVDRATAYKNYQDTFHLTPEEISDRLGQDRTTVTNYLRLLALPADVLDQLRASQLSMGHARAIVGLESAEDQTKLAAQVVEHGLSVRQTESLVAKLKAGPQAAQTKDKQKTPNILDLEQQMMRAVSTKVQIVPSRKKGSGKVVIEYYSLDDFDRILDIICPDREKL